MLLTCPTPPSAGISSARNSGLLRSAGERTFLSLIWFSERLVSDLGFISARTIPAGIVFMCNSICAGRKALMAATRESGTVGGRPM
jgi:hypothetical protein